MEQEAWVLEPPPAVKEAVAAVQARLAHLEWLVPVPAHFLHVLLGPAPLLGARPRDWDGAGSFVVDFRRLNCFHTALVFEAHAPECRALVAGTAVDTPTFLPHLTIGVWRGRPDPEPLRRAVVPLREATLGRASVREALRIRFPAGRTTVLEPWRVVERVSF